MTQIATAKKSAAVARPLPVIVPLIQRELSAGDTAGLEHYRRAGELLLEAREQVAAFKWTAWLSKNFTLSKTTAWRYMRLAELHEVPIGRSGAGTPTTVERLIGEQPRDARRFVGGHKPIREFTKKIDVDSLRQDRQARDDEISLHRELALELVDVGFKALATRLHPDRGGSKDAMRRLNRVRDELRSVAKTRRFE
jgi:hypothetical protein